MKTPTPDTTTASAKSARRQPRMTFLGFPLERAATVVEGLMIGGGIALAFLVWLSSNLNGRLKTAETLATSEAISAADAVAAAANERAANAELKTAELKLKLAEVEARLDDRKFTEEQLDRLHSDLTGPPQCILEIRSFEEDSETVRFARIIAETFVKAGWKWDLIDHAIMSGPYPTDAWLEVTHSGAGDNACVQRIARAFADVGFTPKTRNGAVFASDPIHPGTVRIIVGSKRPKP